MSNTRVLICGDRRWIDYKTIHLVIETVHPTTIICGGAKGADSIAEELAYALGIDCDVFPADWVTYGRAAGYVRNTQMLNEGKPDLVLAFHDYLESSKGTKNMVDQATKSRVPVQHYDDSVEHVDPVVTMKQH